MLPDCEIYAKRHPTVLTNTGQVACPECVIQNTPSTKTGFLRFIELFCSALRVMSSTIRSAACSTESGSGAKTRAARQSVDALVPNDFWEEAEPLLSVKPKKAKGGRPRGARGHHPGATHRHVMEAPVAFRSGLQQQDELAAG